MLGHNDSGGQAGALIKCTGDKPVAWENTGPWGRNTQGLSRASWTAGFPHFSQKAPDGQSPYLPEWGHGGHTEKTPRLRPAKVAQRENTQEAFGAVRLPPPAMSL